MEKTFEPSPYRKKQRRKLFAMCFTFFIVVSTFMWALIVLYTKEMNPMNWSYIFTILWGTVTGFSGRAFYKLYTALR